LAATAEKSDYSPQFLMIIHHTTKNFKEKHAKELKDREKGGNR